MAQCKGCGQRGHWRRAGKKWKLIQPSGEAHACGSYRPQRAPRGPAHKVGPTTKATDFSLPSCPACPLPPWEHCACTALAAEQVNTEADARFVRAMELAEQA